METKALLKQKLTELVSWRYGGEESEERINNNQARGSNDGRGAGRAHPLLAGLSA